MRVQIRTRAARPWRRPGTVVSVALAVTALLGTGLTATAAQAAAPAAAESPLLAEVDAAGTTAAGTGTDDRDIAERVAGSIDARQRKAAESGAKPSAPMIIGGGAESIANAPWMAQLHFFDDQDTEDPEDDLGFFCGGTVVTPTKIVTAAHCVDGLDWTRDSFVVVGTSQLPTVNDDDSVDWHGGTYRFVKRQWKHPSYDVATTDNDVAVLTLSSPVTVKNLPIARSTDTSLYQTGATASVYGWGRYSSTSEDISPYLKRADLPLVADTTCDDYWGDQLIKGHMLCAGTPASGKDAGTTSSCMGDSGGPLVRSGRLIGIVSWGSVTCVNEGSYGVYAKVTAYAGPIRARVYDANWSGDSTADLLARGSSSKSVYPFHSRVSSYSRQSAWTTLSSANLITQTDLDRDGRQDVIRRDTGGAVYWSHYVSGTGWVHTKTVSDWSTRRQIVAPGDVTGDDVPDLLSVTESGNLYIHPGKGDGTFAASVLVGPGWQAYGMVRGHGDFTGDGKADLVARDSSGYLWLYKGTGTAGTSAFAARVKIGGGWNTYNRVVAVGDVNTDGRADLLARDSAGALWLYKGTGSATASATFATRVAFGTGFGGYDLLG
ncbi:trypsin-like serine protease [Streptomyces sp. NPDC101118]|uniref:trypsin-like serine protease n=1 Tax=Streptomyces sp. NPDC101118 TaxID=3366109 RepID=UPI0038169E40